MFSVIEGYERNIVYVDGEDIKVAYALKMFKGLNRSTTTLLGNKEKIIQNLGQAGLNAADPTIEVIEPAFSDKLSSYTNILMGIFKAKGKKLSEGKAEELISRPNYYASLMLKVGEAHCGISGSLSATEAMMRPLIQIIGTGNPRRYLSGAVMLIIPECPYGLNGKLLFSDVAVIPEPGQAQLTDIVLSSYETALALFDGEPKIAVLHYSTKGSAKSDKIDMIQHVVSEVRKANPDIKIDGELQFDAAVIPEVAKSKSAESEVAGSANVLIFPDLASANICVKAVNRLAKTDYYGTIIQGSPIPFNDLSRGSPPIEIAKLSAITLMQLMGKERA